MDLSRLGVTTYGNFRVEVVDPVSDYMELMEVRNEAAVTFRMFLSL